MVNHTSYHRNYSLTSSGGPWAAEEGTYDGSKSEAVRTQVQRTSASFFVRPALHPDLSSSTSDFSSKKCDTMATNVERDPWRTILAVTVLIQLSSSSTIMDIDAAREDGPSVLSSTKS
jgi:hypothetical protein